MRPSGFPSSWTNPFNRGNRGSGAILVGAGAPPPGTHGRDHGPDRSRLGFSNYGASTDAQGSIPTESPLLLVRDRLDGIGAPYLVVSQRRFAEIPFRFRIGDGRVTGRVVIDGRAFALEADLGRDRALPDG